MLLYVSILATYPPPLIIPLICLQYFYEKNVLMPSGLDGDLYKVFISADVDGVLGERDGTG